MSPAGGAATAGDRHTQDGDELGGKMLEASGRLVYVNEPLNPRHPPGHSPGVLRAQVDHAFQYISEDNEDLWLPAFRDTVRLRFHPLAELRRNHRPYDLARTVKYAAGFALGRLRGRRALLDDPYAVLAPLDGPPARLPGGGLCPRPGGHGVQLAAAGLDAAAGRAAGPAGPGPRPPGPVRGRVGGGLRHLCRVGWQVMCWVVSPAGGRRRPPAAWTAGPTWRCGVSASPPERRPHPRADRRVAAGFGYASGNGTR